MTRVATRLTKEQVTGEIAAKTRASRQRAIELTDSERSTSPPRNDIAPHLQIEPRPLGELRSAARKVRKLDRAHVSRVVRSIQQFGFVIPILIDRNGEIVDGHARFQAALELRLRTVPCVCVDHLSDSEIRLLRVSLNRLGELGSWDMPQLQVELVELLEERAPLEVTGFTLPEIDGVLQAEFVAEAGEEIVPLGEDEVTRAGDLWEMDGHRLVCGDARDPGNFALTMGKETARLVLTDPPWNVPVQGHVTGGNHREFAMASGEMSEAQFLEFMTSWMDLVDPHLVDGGLVCCFIDWRGLYTVTTAANTAQLTLLNLAVWAKSNAGMGSLWRSQHELCPIFKKGPAPHLNNIDLGRHGRWRSNLWCYPGASSLGSDARGGLKDHPTTKPVRMLEDAILDVTNRDDIVLDPFLGSGSTLIAAEAAGRRCRAIEIDPRYVDLAVRRWQAKTGRKARLVGSGDTFDVVGMSREVVDTPRTNG